ncbi:hypothetical protein QE152_g32325 [Popillia japonica]|uniref:Uncharacterized protein n=1 Tax=Popillia japonica TaxID=7064 RepID=A0AAW1J001_POPJA
MREEVGRLLQMEEEEALDPEDLTRVIKAACNEVFTKIKAACNEVFTKKASSSRTPVFWRRAAELQCSGGLKMWLQLEDNAYETKEFWLGATKEHTRIESDV